MGVLPAAGPSMRRGERQRKIGGDDKPRSSKVTSRGCNRRSARRGHWLPYQLPGRKRRMAQNTYLGAHWRGRRQWDGLLYSGFSYVNASPSLPAVVLLIPVRVVP